MPIHGGAIGPRMVGLAASLALLAALGPSVASAAVGDDPAPAISYETRFANPGPNGEADSTIEQYVIARLDETQPGTRVGFAVRDWTVVAVADAVRRAAERGVEVTGVIDGGERERPFLIDLVNTLGGRVIFCGSPGSFNSCISNVLMPGLMHNKFWLFSELPDGSRDVVVQTSQNWIPGQRNQFQDLVRINNDSALYHAYSTYLAELHAQNRSDHYYRVTSGDDGRNTMYPMPRRQRDIWTDDTIVDRLDEVRCASPPGTGVVRVAQAFFRRERTAVADKLVALRKEGCEIEVINSNGDPEIVAELVNADVRYYPLYLGLIGVQTHTKYWLADAGSAVTGARTKIVYAGSDNWRADEQQTDDMLLRITDDGVYDAYASHWDGLKARSAFTRKRAPSALADSEGPATAITAADASTPAVTLRVTGSDGVGDSGTIATTGMKRLHIEMTGAQTGTFDLPRSDTGADAPPYTVALTKTLTVSAPGTTTVTAYSEDHKGNVGRTETYVVMNGDEGSTLTTTGAITHPAEHLTVTKVSGAGTVTDHGDGTWTWSHTPLDDDSGTVIVQASDGANLRVNQEFYWHAANVAPTIGALVVNVPDGPACRGAVNRVGVSFTVSDPADETHDPVTGVIDWGDGTTDSIAGRTVSRSHRYTAGTYLPTVSVRDDDGGADDARPATSFSLRYAMTRILPPFRSDGTRLFKYGSTIPVKVRILDCAGSPVPDLTPTVATQRRVGDTPVGPIADATSKCPATGAAMRYDRHRGKYVFNLASRGLTDGPGPYFVYVREPLALGSDSWGNPTPGESSQRFGLW